MEREEAERLVAQYGSAVYRLAYARTGSREDAEDVTQETFLRLVRSSPVFQDGAHEKAWLLRVAAHCAADVFRAPWRKRDLPLEEAAGASAPPPEEPDGGVLAAVLALPEKYRLPVHLFYYEGYSIQEAAERIKVSRMNSSSPRGGCVKSYPFAASLRRSKVPSCKSTMA